MTDNIKVQTSISSGVMKTFLIKGSCIALIGIFSLILASIYLPLTTLTKWGFLIFLFSLGLITYGLLPYRRLSRLQLNPSELEITSTQLNYFSKRKKILSVPLESISQLIYIKDPHYYGIALRLKTQPLLPVIAHQCPREIKKLRLTGQKVHADLFFPYFNQRAYEQLIAEEDDEHGVINHIE